MFGDYLFLAHSPTRPGSSDLIGPEVSPTRAVFLAGGSFEDFSGEFGGGIVGIDVYSLGEGGNECPGNPEANCGLITGESAGWIRLFGDIQGTELFFTADRPPVDQWGNRYYVESGEMPPGFFDIANGIAVDSDDGIYVTDGGNLRVQVYEPEDGPDIAPQVWDDPWQRWKSSRNRLFLRRT